MEKRYTILHNLGRDWEFKPGALYGVGYTGTVELGYESDNERGAASDAAWAVVAKHNRDDRPDGQDAPSFSSGDIVVIYDDKTGLTNEYASTGTELRVVSGLPKLVVRPSGKVGDMKHAASLIQHAIESGTQADTGALWDATDAEDTTILLRWVEDLIQKHFIAGVAYDQWDKVRETING